MTLLLSPADLLLICAILVSVVFHRSKNRTQRYIGMYNSPPRFCPGCGSTLTTQYVQAEERERLVCSSCSEIHYLNPKVVAGVMPTVQGRVWLLRRAIQPRFGAWTFPAGFMEMGETVEQAARRETFEELHMDVRITRLLNIYSRLESPTVLIVYLAEALTNPTGGSEALEFASFSPETIPWKALAFWNTEMALRDWIRSLQSSPSHRTIAKLAEDAKPSD